MPHIEHLEVPHVAVAEHTRSPQNRGHALEIHTHQTPGRTHPTATGFEAVYGCEAGCAA